MQTGFTNFPLVGNSPKLKMIAGTFQVNSTNAPDVLIGHGFSVSAPTSSKFTVTLDKTYHRCVAVVVTIGESTSTQLFKAEVEEIDRTATFSSFVVHTTSTVTDTTTDDQQVNFICIVTDSSIVNERSS